jgi:hypothetical protein
LARRDVDCDAANGIPNSSSILAENRAGLDDPLGCRIANQDGPCAVIKHYESDDSVFIDDAYLVKGVPGRILRKMVCAYLSNGRSEFTNKEIRLDSSLQLPDFKDNLETRLILLRRRVEERCDFLQIVPIGRGRFRFDVKRRLRLESLL